MKERIEAQLELALVHMASATQETVIKEALKTYLSPFGEMKTEIDREQGFNNWLIHDYRKKGHSVTLDACDDLEAKASIEQSIYSVFKVRMEHEKIVLKDVITSVDYILDSEQAFEEGDLLKVRLYPVKDRWIMLDVAEYYASEHEEMIRKSVMSKYNEYCAVNEPLHIRDFVKAHSQLVFHLTNIIDYYEAEMEDDDEYSVYVATYGIKAKEDLLDKLLDSDDFQLVEVEGDETIVDLVSDGEHLAELVITSDRVEIESVTKAGLELVRETFEDHVGSLAVFIKEEMLNIDDLL